MRLRIMLSVETEAEAAAAEFVVRGYGFERSLKLI